VSEPVPSPETLVGFNALLGFRLTDWRPGFAQMDCAIDERHLNRAGILHGGVLATVLDAALGFTGVYNPEPGRRRRCVTLSMTIQYLCQAKGGTIRCTAEQKGGGKSVFMASGEVRGPDGTLLATAQGVYRYIADEPAG
jgi:uncharacterized protein (TIGR00369 family)